jgi:hypothetical protein
MIRRVKRGWFQHSRDLIPEIPISKCPQARIFSGEKAGRNPILVKVMDIFGNRISQAYRVEV